MKNIETAVGVYEIDDMNHEVLTQLGAVEGDRLREDSALYDTMQTMLSGSEPGLVQPRDQYSCVFVFGTPGVLLVRKSHPSWQKGRLNGIGGALEPGETPEMCARREFLEETGKNPPALRRFCTLTDSGVIVHFFTGEWAGEDPPTLRDLNDKSEPLEWHPLQSEIVGGSNGGDDTVGHPQWQDPDEAIDNLAWLIPMARDRFHVDALVTAMRRDASGNPVR